MTAKPSDGDRSAATQEAIYAALEALQTAMDADLCAFLTQDPGQGPQLFLGVPDLGAIDPNKAFALFSSLREALTAETEPTEHMVAGYESLLVPLVSASGKALLAVGRKNGAPTPKERDSAIRFAGALTRLLRLGTPVISDPARRRVVRLGIESSADRCSAEVSLDIGEQVLHGAAEDAVPMRAVASATLDAAGPLADGLKLVHVADGDVATSRAVLALLIDERERAWLGSALVDENADPLHAAARATLAAILQTKTEA